MKKLKTKQPTKAQIAKKYRRTVKVLAKAKQEYSKPEAEPLQVVYTNDSGAFRL